MRLTRLDDWPVGYVCYLNDLGDGLREMVGASVEREREKFNNDHDASSYNVYINTCMTLLKRWKANKWGSCHQPCNNDAYGDECNSYIWIVSAKKASGRKWQADALLVGLPALQITYCRNSVPTQQHSMEEALQKYALFALHAHTLYSSHYQRVHGHPRAIYARGNEAPFVLATYVKWSIHDSESLSLMRPG